MGVGPMAIVMIAALLLRVAEPTSILRSEALDAVRAPDRVESLAARDLAETPDRSLTPMPSDLPGKFAILPGSSPVEPKLAAELSRFVLDPASERSDPPDPVASSAEGRSALLVMIERPAIRAFGDGFSRKKGFAMLTRPDRGRWHPGIGGATSVSVSVLPHPAAGATSCEGIRIRTVGLELRPWGNIEGVE